MKIKKEKPRPKTSQWRLAPPPRRANQLRALERRTAAARASRCRRARRQQSAGAVGGCSRARHLLRWPGAGVAVLEKPAGDCGRECGVLVRGCGSGPCGSSGLRGGRGCSPGPRYPGPAGAAERCVYPDGRATCPLICPAGGPPYL